jgi:peroxiredoxin
MKGVEMSNKIEINLEVADFTLDDWQGNPVSLSDFKGKKHVVLVLNRGFM